MLYTFATEISDLKCLWCYKHIVGPYGMEESALDLQLEYLAQALPPLCLFHTMRGTLFEIHGLIQSLRWLSELAITIPIILLGGRGLQWVKQ